jgi:hypothetical protein
VAERSRRRIERHLAQACLPVGKTLATFDFEAVPMVSKAQVTALVAGGSWLEKGANVLLFGPPGAGKSHLAAAIGLALVENGRRVLFTRTNELVQRLQIARRELGLESAIVKLDKYHLIILDAPARSVRSPGSSVASGSLIGPMHARTPALPPFGRPMRKCPFTRWRVPPTRLAATSLSRILCYIRLLGAKREAGGCSRVTMATPGSMAGGTGPIRKVKRC